MAKATGKGSRGGPRGMLGGFKPSKTLPRGNRLGGGGPMSGGSAATRAKATSGGGGGG